MKDEHVAEEMKTAAVGECREDHGETSGGGGGTTQEPAAQEWLEGGNSPGREHEEVEPTERPEESVPLTESPPPLPELLPPAPRLLPSPRPPTTLSSPNDISKLL